MSCRSGKVEEGTKPWLVVGPEGGARSKVCQKTLKTSFGSKCAIFQHDDKEAVKVLHAAAIMKREAITNEPQAVGLLTNHVGKCTVGCWSPSKKKFSCLGSCLDHTFELGTEESTQQGAGMKDSVKKV